MTRNWSVGRSVERAMILEESKVLRPDYLPFAVAQRQAAYTACEMTSGSGNGANTTHLPEGRSLPKLVIPAELRWKKGSAHWLNLRCRRRMAIRHMPAKLLDISPDGLRYKLKKFGLLHAEEDEPSAANS